MLRTNFKGFTIVELLIVIVVISILASITVTAFGNVQSRAKAQQAASLANAYIKLLKLHKTDKGTFPASVSDAYPTWGDACLGLPADFPAEAPYSAGDCLHNTADTYRVGGSTSIINALAPYGRIPGSSKLTSSPYGPESWRGIRYTHSANWQSPILEYLVRGDFRDTCPTGGNGSYYDGYTLCDMRNLHQ